MILGYYMNRAIASLFTERLSFILHFMSFILRAKNAVRNFAILRRMVHNLLKADRSIKKSLPMKQMRAMASEVYRNKLLSLAG